MFASVLPKLEMFCYCVSVSSVCFKITAVLQNHLPRVQDMDLNIN